MSASGPRKKDGIAGSEKMETHGRTAYHVGGWPRKKRRKRMVAMTAPSASDSGLNDGHAWSE